MKGVSKLKADLQNILTTTDWNAFSGEKSLVPMLETHALIENAVKKCDKVINNIMADTIHDKE